MPTTPPTTATPTTPSSYPGCDIDFSQPPSSPTNTTDIATWTDMPAFLRSVPPAEHHPNDQPLLDTYPTDTLAALDDDPLAPISMNLGLFWFLHLPRSQGVDSGCRSLLSARFWCARSALKSKISSKSRSFYGRPLRLSKCLVHNSVTSMLIALLLLPL